MQNKLVAEQIELCGRGHKFYKQRWDEHGIDPATIRNIDDLEKLPLTSKKDLMDDPEAFRLHCPDLPLEQRTLWEVNYTTGSTSDPTRSMSPRTIMWPISVWRNEWVRFREFVKTMS